MATNPFRPSRATNPFAPSAPPETAVGEAVPAGEAVGTGPAPDSDSVGAGEAVGDRTRVVVSPSTAVERLHAAVGAAASAMREIDPEDLDADSALQVIQDLKVFSGSKSQGHTLERDLKARLWTLVGRTVGNHRTPGGVTFKFRSGSKPRRATQFNVLETKYPEAYRECVTVTPADPTAVGALYL